MRETEPRSAGHKPRSAGDERWSFTPPGRDPIVGEPLVIGSSVLFTRGDRLHSLDRATGALKWSHLFVPRRGLARWFSRHGPANFEASYGIPLLSRIDDRVVVSFHTPEGEFRDVAVNADGNEEGSPPDFDPFTLRLPGRLRVDVDGIGDGILPVLKVCDDTGRFLWDSRRSLRAETRDAEWISPLGRPVAAGDHLLFGIEQTTLERGDPVGYRLAALRLADGELAWEVRRGRDDVRVIGYGFDEPWCWMLVRQRSGIPLLRLHHIEHGEIRAEGRFPGLSGGVTIATGMLYGGFGKTFVAVALAL